MNKSLDLNERIIDNRTKKLSPIITFDLNEILNHFNETICDIQSQGEIANKLPDNNKTDAENIWRAQIIFLASALDFYMHEITKYGLLRMFKNDWKRSTKYNNLSIKLEYLDQLLDTDNASDNFNSFINNLYQDVTLLSFISIKEQLNLLDLNLKTIADESFYDINSTEKTTDKLKCRLNELFTRRNIIAHQYDRQHKNAQRMPISSDIVNGFIHDIIKIVKAIHKTIFNKPII